MATKPVLTDLDFQGSGTLLNIRDGVAPQEPATVAQLRAVQEGNAWKDNVRVAAPANVNLAAPGATVDGAAMAAGDRFLAPNQTVVAENGLYVWNGAAVPATRALDANTWDELKSARVPIDQGTSAGVVFQSTSAMTGTLGTTAITFTAAGSSAPPASEGTAGVARIATQAEVNAGTLDGVIVSPQKLGQWAGRALRYPATFGDGSATSFTLTHNLGTEDVDVTVRETGGQKRGVEVEWRAAGINAVVIVTNVAPAAGALRALVTA